MSAADFGSVSGIWEWLKGHAWILITLLGYSVAFGLDGFTQPGVPFEEASPVAGILARIIFWVISVFAFGGAVYEGICLRRRGR